MKGTVKFSLRILPVKPLRFPLSLPSPLLKVPLKLPFKVSLHPAEAHIGEDNGKHLETREDKTVGKAGTPSNKRKHEGAQWETEERTPVKGGHTFQQRERRTEDPDRMRHICRTKPARGSPDLRHVPGRSAPPPCKMQGDDATAVSHAAVPALGGVFAHESQRIRGQASAALAR